MQPKHLYRPNIFGACARKYCQMLHSNWFRISTVYISTCHSLHMSVFCSIFPSPEQQLTASLKPAVHNTGGSLPDLTNIQFPPPLPTPLDSDDAAAASFSSSNSTQALANTQGNGSQRLPAHIQHIFPHSYVPDIDFSFQL